jgi:hypothetical protein
MKRWAALLFLTGAAMAATPEIIILQISPGSTGDTVFNYLYWIPISTAAAIPTTSSSAWTGATVAENQAIQNGTILEENRIGTAFASMTLGQIETNLVNGWNTENTRISNLQNPMQYYGSIYDGTSWTLGASSGTPKE